MKRPITSSRSQLQASSSVISTDSSASPTRRQRDADLPSISDYVIHGLRPKYIILIAILIGCILIVALVTIIAVITVRRARIAAQQERLNILWECGKAVGEFQDGIYQFRGIPYAFPPIGSKRFMPPQSLDAKCSKSSYERQNLYNEHQSKCIQNFNDLQSGSEDCLYLNIYSPDTKPSTLFPVIVVIGGFFFQFGGANQPGFKILPEIVLQVNSVHVTFNYRLGILGFNDHGNFGLQDQKTVLQWVHNNIENFGGNPDNVMLFGYGSGATSALLLTSSSNKWFHKMWISSPTWVSNDTTSKQLFTKNICQSNLQCLQKLPIATLLNPENLTDDKAQLKEALFDLPKSNTNVRPSLNLKDNKFRLYNNYEDIEKLDMPIVIGNVEHEVDLFLLPPGVRIWNNAKYKDHLHKQLNITNNDHLITYYFDTNSHNPVDYIHAEIITDIRVTCPLNCFTSYLRKRIQSGSSVNSKVYRYVVKDVHPFFDPYNLQYLVSTGFHGWDAMLYFKGYKTHPNYDQSSDMKSQEIFSNILITAMKQFAWTGSISAWNHRNTALLDESRQINVEDYKENHCAIWQKLFNQESDCYKYAWRL